MYIAVAVLRVNCTLTQGIRSHERGSVDVSNCDAANMRVRASRLRVVQRLRQTFGASKDERRQFV